MTQNWPAFRFKPRLIIKTVASSATPEALGTTERMAGVTFIGQKAVGTDNIGTVTIQIDDVDAFQIQAGTVWTWPAPTYEAGYYLAQDFKIKVATNGDGVIAIYSERQ